MAIARRRPWVSGPEEILKHGLELLKRDTDASRRLAMIIVDNAVELMIKTYLGLPERVTGLKISRSEYQKFSESFPRLLDALENFAADKLDGIDLGEIEWYHQVRNSLYHQGIGVTVERDKVEIYAQLANVLFTNLFGFRLVEPEEEDEVVLLGGFMQAWVDLEKAMSKAIVSLPVSEGFYRHPARIRYLEEVGFISKAELAEIERLRGVRNGVVHGDVKHKDVLKSEMVDRIVSLTAELEKRLQAFL